MAEPKSVEVYLGDEVPWLTIKSPDADGCIEIACGQFAVTLFPGREVFHMSYGRLPADGKRDTRLRSLVINSSVENLGEVLSFLREKRLLMPVGFERFLERLLDGSLPIGDSTQGEIEITHVIGAMGDGWATMPTCRVLFPNGQSGTYFSFGMPSPDVGAVSVLPLTDSNQIGVINAYRHNMREQRLEVINGVIDPGESVEQAALRESLEEGGLRATSHTESIDLGDYVGNLGGETGKHRLLLVRGLLHDDGIGLGGSGEAISGITLFPVPELLERYKSGEIIDGKLAALLMRALLHDLLPGARLQIY